MITFHVATTGNNGDGGGAGDPWLTILHALGQVSAGDEISVADGTYDEGAFGLIPPAVDFSADPVRVFSATADRANVTIKGDDAGNRLAALLVNNATKGLVFEDITFAFAGDGSAAEGSEYVIRFNHDDASDFLFQGCAVTLPAIARTQYAVRLAGDQDSITFDYLTIAIPDVAGNFGIYCANNAPTNITMSNSTITGANASTFPVWFEGGIGEIPTGITLTDNTITSGDQGVIFRDVQNLTVTDCEITVAGVFGLQFGEDVDPPILGAATGTISRNRVRCTKADGHGMLIGRGTNAVLVEGNITYSSGGASFGIVVKGDDIVLQYNIVFGTFVSYLLKGAVGTVFRRNHGTTTTGAALRVSGVGGAAHRDSDDSTVVNNMLVVLDAAFGEVLDWTGHGETREVERNALIGPLGDDLPESEGDLLAKNGQALPYGGWAAVGDVVAGRVA